MLYAANVKNGSAIRQTNCTALSGAIGFFMTFSVLWPSVVCFDLLQNTRDPRWRWDSPQKIERTYLAVIGGLAFLAVIAVVVHAKSDYCLVDQYTPPTEFTGVILEFVLPLVAFVFNAAVIIVVRRSLGNEMPFSVRTRRRRQMHNYVLVWCFCWGPFLVNAIFCAICQHGRYEDARRLLFFIRNLSLYSTGWLDLLVYGLQNAWLKRSLRMACDRCRMTDICCMENVQASYLRNTKDKVRRGSISSLCACLSS